MSSASGRESPESRSRFAVRSWGWISAAKDQVRYVRSVHEVALELVAPADAGLLSNLLELYIHDLSDVFLVELGADGRFGYRNLELYWSEPERRFPFFVKYDGRVVGFVLATRGSPVTDDRDVFDIAEFFVLRRYRRSGVGKQAAMLLWQRLPGTWIVRVSQGNRGALPFWTRVIGEASAGTASAFERAGNPHPLHVFRFDAGRQSADNSRTQNHE